MCKKRHIIFIYFNKKQLNNKPISKSYFSTGFISKKNLKNKIKIFNISSLLLNASNKKKMNKMIEPHKNRNLMKKRKLKFIITKTNSSIGKPNQIQNKINKSLKINEFPNDKIKKDYKNSKQNNKNEKIIRNNNRSNNTNININICNNNSNIIYNSYFNEKDKNYASENIQKAFQIKNTFKIENLQFISNYKI